LEQALWSRLPSERVLAVFTALTIYKFYGMNVVPAKHQVFVSYLYKVYKITRVANPVIFLALKYMHRLRPLYQGNRQIALTGLFTTALILANHVLDDNAYTNKTWGQVTGIHHTMINTTQRQLMAIMNYRLHVSVEEYDAFIVTLYSYYTEFSAASKKKQTDALPTQASGETIVSNTSARSNEKTSSRERPWCSLCRQAVTVSEKFGMQCACTVERMSSVQAMPSPKSPQPKRVVQDATTVFRRVRDGSIQKVASTSALPGTLVSTSMATGSRSNSNSMDMK
jgi:hypothetical protein